MNSDNNEIKKRFDFDLLVTWDGELFVGFVRGRHYRAVGDNLLDTMTPLANIEQAYDGCQLCPPCLCCSHIVRRTAASVNGYAH